MTDYKELIRSLRNCSNNRCAPCDCEWFNKYQVDESCKEIIMWKAADAIEALQAEVPKRGEIVRCKECRWGHLCVTGQHLGLDGFCSKGEREVQE